MGCLVRRNKGRLALAIGGALLGLLCAPLSGNLVQAQASIGGEASTSQVDTVLRDTQVFPRPEVIAAQGTDLDVAQAVIKRYASKWSIASQTMHFERVVPGVNGLKTIRFKQTVNDIEVLGSLVAITLDNQQRLVSYQVTLLQVAPTTRVTPVLTEQEATESTRQVVAVSHHAASTEVQVQKLRPVIAHSSLVDGISSGLQLAWSAWTIVHNSPQSAAISLLDDATSQILVSRPLASYVTYEPNVCDLQQANTSDYSSQGSSLGSPNGLVQNYGGYKYLDPTGYVYPLCGVNYAGRNVAETDTARTHIDTTWAYYKDVLGIDINQERWLGNISTQINGDSNPRISAFINTCLYSQRTQCPNYGNAFWVPWSAPTSICRSGACSAIFLGSGFDQALDVIAHELTHGITFSVAFQEPFSLTSETAALSEGLSDVFGEAAQRLSPTAKPDPLWLIGEDVVGASAGPYRIMKTGTSLEPDGSRLSVAAITPSWKRADGHINSGPLNRFAWLVSNGATVGSTVVSPIGSVPGDGVCNTLSECTAITRMSKLVYSTLPMLSGSATYFDFGRAVMNSCQTLVNQKVSGFTATVCVNVAKALRLTGITKFSITNATTNRSVQQSSYVIIRGSVQSYTGAPVFKQPMKLQRWINNRWVTILAGATNCSKYCTSASGQVTFVTKLPRSTRYRIIADSNFGAMAAQMSPGYMRVY